MRRDGTVLGESAVGRKLVALTTRRVIILVRRRRALFSLMEVPRDFHRFPNSIHGWSSKLRHKQTQALSNLYQIFIKYLSNLYQIFIKLSVWTLTAWVFLTGTGDVTLYARRDLFGKDLRWCGRHFALSASTFPMLTRHLLSTTITQIWMALRCPQWLVVLLTESVKIADITSAPFEDISILWC